MSLATVEVPVLEDVEPDVSVAGVVDVLLPLASVPLPEALPVVEPEVELVLGCSLVVSLATVELGLVLLEEDGLVLEEVEELGEDWSLAYVPVELPVEVEAGVSVDAVEPLRLPEPLMLPAALPLVVSVEDVDPEELGVVDPYVEPDVPVLP